MSFTFPIPRRTPVHYTCRNPICPRVNCDAWAMGSTCTACGGRLIKRWAR